MAEGAPLLREYLVYPGSRVRIPPSPPFFLDWHRLNNDDEIVHCECKWYLLGCLPKWIIFSSLSLKLEILINSLLWMCSLVG